MIQYVIFIYHMCECYMIQYVIFIYHIYVYIYIYMLNLNQCMMTKKRLSLYCVSKLSDKLLEIPEGRR